MNGFSSLAIWAIVAAAVVDVADTFHVSDLRQCCAQNKSVLSRSSCGDGAALNITCNDTEPLMSFDNQFLISEDYVGVYVDIFEPDSIIREPNFCVGTSWISAKKVVVICGPQFWTDRIEEPVSDEVLSVSLASLNFLSFLCLMLVSFLYYSLQILQDIHNTCIFHFILNSGIWHGILAYRLLFQIFEYGSLLCITNVFIWGYVALTSFFWSGILSYDTWRQSYANYTADESVLLFRYRICGYGVPAFLVLLSSAHTYIGNYPANRFDNYHCYTHQNVLLFCYMLLPISAILVTNFYFFVDSQRRFSRMYASQSKSNLQKLKCRLYVNLRLFFLMGLPWSVGVMLALFDFTIYEFPFSFILVLYIVVSSEGVSIAIVLVLLRKRVLREIATSKILPCVKVPEKWKTLNDSETVEESDDIERVGGGAAIGAISSRFDNTNSDRSVSPFVERSFANIAAEL